MRVVAAITVFLALDGRTTEQATNNPDGGRDFVIGCGARLGWNVCYRRANDICPSGYSTMSENAGFNRKELTISCPTASTATVQGAYARCNYEATLATVSLQQGKEEAQSRLFQQCMAARAADAARQPQ